MTFIRYFGVQLLAYCIDMGIFLISIYSSFLGPIASNILSKIVAGLFAFIVHRSFTFQVEKNQREKKHAFKYFLLLGLNIPLSTSLLGFILLFTDWTVAAKFIADAIIILFTFWISKTWVFSTSQSGLASNTNKNSTS